MTLVLAILAPALVSAILARSLLRLRIPALIAVNVSGRPVPAVLGIALAASWVAIQSGALAASIIDARWSPVATRLLLTLIAGIVIAGVGFLDDLTSTGPRGLRGHARALLAGHVSTGIAKIIGIVVAGGIVVVAQGGTLLSASGLLSIVAIAGAANLANGLDVAPGRAGKWFLVAAALLLFLTPHTEAWVALLVLCGAELPLLPLDLGERGMLGDTGANLLGFTAGAALVAAMGTPGLAVTAVILIGANIFAETVGLSRLIGVARPLRWFDGLGRAAPPADPSLN